MNFSEIVAAIKADTAPTPLMIAIEGYGGSGKSTIAEKLKNALGNTYVINIDDFIIKKNLLDKSPDKTAFDRERLEQEVLIPATTGRPIVYRRLEWDEDALSDPITVPDSDYLIVEGISSFHPAIAKYYDYKIWVDTPMDVAKQRGRTKDAGNENEQHWDLWAENDLAYQQKYHPERYADFILANTDKL